MRKIHDKFVVLAYWCLCDGLKDRNCRPHTHRHMIVAFDKTGGFDKVWKEKVMYDLQEKGAKIKRTRQIKNAFHLIRTIVYVSRPRASCNRGIPDDDADLKKTLSHFCINRPVYRHAVAFLSTLFLGGIEDLLSEQNKNKNVITWEEFEVEVRDGSSPYTKWAVPIRKTRWKFQNCVIPVEKQYEPTDEETDFYVYMYVGVRDGQQSTASLK
ncbi:hypothetical protein AVEN_20604-1 [Araneus ventricosus]|uniref:Uncharacterized protein n=1 Tax=Araneus ventricosus TaxID=182803 RepID=A0A4Y2VFP3_ARAVE|nr:hypothetical protein AVEN_20604-1 [Araneus ventricosus]